MRILELTNFSAGGCGVWHRVKQEAEFLSKNHEVLVMSSDIVKGTKEHAPFEENLGKVKIRRFPALKLGGDSFMEWNLKNQMIKEALKFKPEIVIAHSYRHRHTKYAIEIARRTGAKTFLVTHAPFDRSDTRSFAAKLSVSLYDKIKGPSLLKKYTKIIAISKWEMPYLKKLGLKENKIEYLPNGIGEEFFTKAKDKRKNKAIFIGRISPIKGLDTAVMAFSQFPSIYLEIFGPAEASYKEKLVSLISKNMGDNIIITDTAYNHAEQIKKLDESSIFVFPSKSEGMPQTLIEAMARGCIIIASDIPATRDLIKNGKNGFLFKKGNVQDLASKISHVFDMKISEKEKIRKSAIESVKEFSWERILSRFEKIIQIH